MTEDPRKRRLEDSGALVPAPKKQKLEPATQGGQLIEVDVPRTSKLQAPIMLLTGHGSEVYSVRFSPNGESIATCSRDKLILLWKVYGDCENYLMLQGHKNAVLEVAWSHDNNSIYSASADKTVGVWDVTTGRRKLRLSDHKNYVNSVAAQRAGSDSLVSASDDSTVRVWDTRTKKCAMTIPHSYPVTAVAMNDELHQVFSGGLDNDIRCFDLRTPDTPVFVMKGHMDTITSLRVDPYGSYLLSNAMDNTVRIWDIRPYQAAQRCIKIFVGASHSSEKLLIRSAWANDGSMIASGSADKMVYIWDTTSRAIKYCLPGHTGCVTDVDFHPKEPIIASCSTDKKIYLGELQEE